MAQLSDNTLYSLFSFLRKKRGEKLPILLSLKYDETFTGDQGNNLLQSLGWMEPDGTSYAPIEDVGNDLLRYLEGDGDDYSRYQSFRKILNYLYDYNKEKLISLYNFMDVKRKDVYDEEYNENVGSKIIITICTIALTKKDVSLLQNIQKLWTREFKQSIRYNYKANAHDIVDDEIAAEIFKIVYKAVYLYDLRDYISNIIQVLSNKADYDNPILAFLINAANSGEVNVRYALYYSFRPLIQFEQWTLLFNIIDKLDSLDKLDEDNIYPISLVDGLCSKQKFDWFEQLIKMNKFSKEALAAMRKDLVDFKVTKAVEIIDKFTK